MPHQVIVESYGCYQDFRKNEGAEEVNYLTTSPFLLYKLPMEDQKVASLEQGIERGEIDGLARATYDIAALYTSELNKICKWRGYADLELVFSSALQKCLYLICYKGFLLQRVIDRLGPQEQVVCVGDVDKVGQRGIELEFGRFDTLYAYIAARTGWSAIKIYETRVSEERIQRLSEMVSNRKLGKLEKLLSLLNNTTSSFAYKMWRNLSSRGIYPFERISITPRVKRDLFVFRDNEIIHELFLSLLVRGARIGVLSPLPRIRNGAHGFEALPDREELSKLLGRCIGNGFRKFGVIGRDIHETCRHIVEERFFTALARLRAEAEELSKGFDAVCRRIGSRSAIVTTEFAECIEKLFYCYCRAEKIPVVVVEHGITNGLSEYSNARARQSGMVYGDLGVYHSHLSLAEIDKHNPVQKKLLCGLPIVTSRVRFSSLQRFIARKMLRVAGDETLVMYVADLDRNNYIFGPCVDTDLEFAEKTRKIVAFLNETHPEARICLKLYPTTRYLDRYRFEDLKRICRRLIIPEDVEFRFIRAAADRIYTTSFFSTLGWVLGSGRPFCFVKVPWSPVRFGAGEAKAISETISISAEFNLKIPIHRPFSTSKDLLSCLS
jgi:hypothetical protein